MSKKNQPQLGTVRRRIVSLLTASVFMVLAVTGVLAFVRPFSIGIIGLHSLMVFLFIVLIGLHILNNARPMRSYFHSRVLWLTLAATLILTLLFWTQPAPIKAVLKLSGNLGPAMERFEMREDGMVFEYAAAPSYKIRLNVKTGKSFDPGNKPQVAIWLENEGEYHIKTLLAAENGDETPYWKFKLEGWEAAKRAAEDADEIDAVSSPTPNGSFDPADYILPKAADEGGAYRLLLEINQSGDGQASLVYSVEIDNSLPKTYQILDLLGYPKRGVDAGDGKQEWELYYADGTFNTALDLIDSALLTIQR